MSGRAYDYACPAFGGFCVPESSWESKRRDTSYRSAAALVKQASIVANNANASLSRTNSREGRAPFSRTDSSPRSPLTRMDSGPRSPLTRMDSAPRSPLARGDSLSSRTESSYSSTSTGTGLGARPTIYSSSTYTSPRGTNYRHFSYK